MHSNGPVLYNIQHCPTYILVTTKQMPQYQYNERDVEKGVQMSRADERMAAYKTHAEDQMNTLKRRPSMSDHGHRLIRKTSSRLGIGRKNSIGFHNDGTIWEHIVSCKCDTFDCCVLGFCYGVIGMFALGFFLAFVSENTDVQTAGYFILFLWTFYCLVFNVINCRGGWKS